MNSDGTGSPVNITANTAGATNARDSLLAPGQVWYAEP
jgi:hypothetical protein